MAQWVCERCGAGFTRDKAGDKVIRFCSQACYHQWRANAGFNPGGFGTRPPWNKGTKGIRLNPATEFKKGLIPANKAAVGSVKIRTRKRDGQRRAWVKIAEPNIWRQRATVVWESKYGALPKGLVIHHLDRDPLNDTLANLAALSRAAHLLEHRPEFEVRRRAALVKRPRAA